MSFPGLIRVQDFRTCTDFELRQVIDQAAIAAYILEQRELIASMIRDHGRVMEKLLAEKRELQTSRAGESPVAGRQSPVELTPQQKRTTRFVDGHRQCCVTNGSLMCLFLKGHNGDHYDATLNRSFTDRPFDFRSPDAEGADQAHREDLTYEPCPGPEVAR